MSWKKRLTVYWQNANGICLWSRRILMKTTPKFWKTFVTSAARLISSSLVAKLLKCQYKHYSTDCEYSLCDENTCTWGEYHLRILRSYADGRLEFWRPDQNGSFISVGSVIVAWRAAARVTVRTPIGLQEEANIFASWCGFRGSRMATPAERGLMGIWRKDIVSAVVGADYETKSTENLFRLGKANTEPWRLTLLR